MKRHARVAAACAVVLTASVVGFDLHGGVASADIRTTGSTVTVNKTVTRTNLVNGAEKTIESKNVSLTVERTTGLRSRQVVTVSWTGAHPTGGTVADLNGGSASVQEYPMMLVECRGTPDQITQQTCWTQTSQERFVSTNNTAFPPYRMDQFASGADRAQSVGAPAVRPASCSPTLAEHWEHFVAVNGVDYPGGENGCGGIPPEAGNLTTQNFPSDTTYADTLPDGTGQTKFTIWTHEDNGSLGCSTTVPCSFVAIPIMGISCDSAGSLVPAADQPAPGSEETAADKACNATGKLAPGAPLPGNATASTTDQAVTGALWWSPSNWNNRIAIPLGFAEDDSACSVTNAIPNEAIYGSEILTGATSQWAPGFCGAGSSFKFTHVQVGEPQAKNLLDTNNIKAAFTSEPQPNGFLQPTVQAPVAVTGFAITYDIDDNTGKEYDQLKLTPRLLAKLMTESYTDNTLIQSQYYKYVTVNGTVQKDAAGNPIKYFPLENNPLNITKDPEFLALNPDVKRTIVPDAAAALLDLSSDSDVMYALTSYIWADPEARAWLMGAPDPWGMVVNPNYQIGAPGVTFTMPTQSFPLLDTFIPDDRYQTDPCLAPDPVPYLPLVASPTSRLLTTALDMQYALSYAQVECDDSTSNPKLTTQGRQTPGGRFIIGVTSLADADRYEIPTAALETQTASSAPPKFTDATGRTFVTPSDDSLKAAIDLATPDANAGTWTIPYDTLRSQASAAGAYPGTMLVNLTVPLEGLSTTDATRLGSLLTTLSTTDQAEGSGVGQLPDGYLPITAANGLADFVAYSQTAAAAISSQTGVVPPLTPIVAVVAPTPAAPAAASSPASVATTAKASGAKKTASAAKTTAAAVASAASPAASPFVAPLPSTGPELPAPKPAQTPGPVSSLMSAAADAPVATSPAAAAAPAGFVLTSPQGAGVGGLILPILLAVLLVAGISLLAERLVRSK